MIPEVELALEKEGVKLFRVRTVEGVGFLILTLLGRFDLTKSLIALAIVVTSMG